jgi:hypothetical protein
MSNLFATSRSTRRLVGGGALAALGVAAMLSLGAREAEAGVSRRLARYKLRMQAKSTVKPSIITRRDAVLLNPQPLPPDPPPDIIFKRRDAVLLNPQPLPPDPPPDIIKSSLFKKRDAVLLNPQPLPPDPPPDILKLKLNKRMLVR